ncbi:hypothetical protein K503DRAFT_399816 [Rhizopogon vinicolor AM-OR11-026]|uniref:Uncharacterized protein n=1 Tax=Rhizopogon vinicolor AM-OR11-026 TaxID=1314800 RepID=A0A1B7MR09_9AGAM|nr:hypothetical protein K503DRAFT_399816 [Rhizopogon vinicolor AM-OR11-026]
MWVLELVAVEDGVVMVPEEARGVVSVAVGVLRVVAETVPLVTVLSGVLLVPLSVPLVVVVVAVDTGVLEPAGVKVPAVVELPVEVELPESEPPAEPVIPVRLFDKKLSTIGISVRKDY